MPDYDDELQYLSGDERILAECRDRFDYACDQWESIREAAREDMKFVSGDPWPEAEKLQRKGIRPCLVMDEYGQYANQVINDIRQNKRAIQVEPEGFGANDQTAELVGDLFRNIEYESNAQSAYICGFENMLNRSYGGWIVRHRYVSDKSFDQKLVIDRIANPDSSYPDPDCKCADYSDARYWFLLDLVPRKEYKRKYPKATITDFDTSHMRAAPNWIKEDQIQVAEYWVVNEEKRKLYLVRIDDKPPVVMAEDELPEGFDVAKESADGGRILNERESTVRKVVQYITNGVEILETNPQPGKYIPIIWLTGKELYIDDGATGPRKYLMSLVRPMRDPLMMVNYIATCKAEVIGITPKTPWIGYTGQFQKPDNWQAANMTPTAFLEANAKTEATGDILLPLPTRMPYEPQIQQLEIAQESARRSVQAAGGMTALPTNAQRLSEKSGKALEAIDANEDRGTFHFIDNYKMAIAHTGTVMEDLRRYVYDGQREIGVRNKKGEHRVVKINQKYTDADGEHFHDMTAGEHKITIGSGPSFESEREAASEFVDTIVPELEQIVADPVVKMKLAALLVKLKNIGPIGDEIVELLSPKDGPDQSAAQLQQVTAQSQQYQQMVAQLQTEVQRLELEKKAKVIDNQFMLQKAQLDNKLKLDIAEITTKSQDQAARDRLTADLMSELHVAAHEAATQAVEHAHAKHLAAHAAANAQATQSSDQSHQLAMAAQTPPQPSNSGNGAGA